MSVPIAAKSVSWWRRGLVAAVALGLGMMCASFVVGSSTAFPSLTTAPMSVSMDVIQGDLRPVTEARPALMAGMCDVVCTSAKETACSLAAVGAPITLLGLLLTRRRQSYLGSLGRATGAVCVPRLRRTWRGWFLLSPVSLCTWRV